MVKINQFNYKLILFISVTIFYYNQYKIIQYLTVDVFENIIVDTIYILYFYLGLLIIILNCTI
jgi:hypothetical protein